jgi:hypothetical protein
VTSSVPLATNVASAVVSYPTTGACKGQFQLALTISGTTNGNGTPDYNLTFCATPRA